MAPKKSNIWNFFTAKPKSDKVGVCNICKLEISFKSTSNNLKKHMQRKHPLVNMDNISTSGVRAREIQAAESTNSNNSIEHTTGSVEEAAASSSTQSQTVGSLRTPSIETFMRKKLGASFQKKIDGELMLLFTKDFQPFSVVEDEGFKRFVSALNPSYQLPSRKTISNTFLPAMYEEVYLKTKEVVKQAHSVTLTTDSWTSRNSESFLAVTLHFIDSNFKVQNLLIECIPLNINHTSLNLSLELKRIIEEWNLEEKILLIVSDNAANIKKAIFDLKYKHFGCYAHTINLIAQDSITIVRPVIEKVKSVVSFFKRSSSSMAKLLEQQKLLNEVPKKLIQDIQTRWNSTFYMVKRFTELEAPIRTTMALLNKVDLPIISVEEWKFFKEIVTVLEPLEAITKVMSCQNYVTASSVIILTDGLIDAYKDLQKNAFSDLSKSVISSILKGIQARLGDLENSLTLTITTFLDPRFKTVGFSDPAIGERTKNAITSLICSNLKHLVEGPTHSATSFAEDKAISASTETDPDSSQKCILWKNFEKKRAKIQPSGTALSRAIIEVQRYLEDPLIPREEDPVLWWKNNAYNFPYLSKLVKEKFVTIATSVPCEREFSKSGLILSDRRSRLSSSKVKHLLFLNSNQELVN